VSGVYSVTLRASVLDQQVINNWDYTVTTPLAAPTALELLTLLGFIPTGDPAELPDDTMFAAVRAAVSNYVNFLEVECRELYSVTDFYTAAYSPAVMGDQANGITSPVLAYGLFSNRVRTDIRRGFKRLSGVSESQIGTGGLLESAQLTLMTAVATKMSEPLIGIQGTYQPSILSFEAYTTPKLKTAYKPYPTRDEQLEHAAIGVSWAPYDRARSQTSRQIGRGA